MELDELFYTGAKLVSVKIWVPLKNTNKILKPELEIRMETQFLKKYDNKQK